MRTLLAVTALLMLSACQADAPGGLTDRFKSKDERAKTDDATCQSYGAKPGSDAYIACRVEQDRIRASSRRRATVCRPVFNTMMCT